jgi:hypothetical protein
MVAHLFVRQPSSPGTLEWILGVAEIIIVEIFIRVMGRSSTTVHERRGRTVASPRGVALWTTLVAPVSLVVAKGRVVTGLLVKVPVFTEAASLRLHGTPRVLKRIYIMGESSCAFGSGISTSTRTGS